MLDARASQRRLVYADLVVSTSFGPLRHTSLLRASHTSLLKPLTYHFVEPRIHVGIRASYEPCIGIRAKFSLCSYYKRMRIRSNSKLDVRIRGSYKKPSRLRASYTTRSAYTSHTAICEARAFSISVRLLQVIGQATARRFPHRGSLEWPSRITVQWRPPVSSMVEMMDLK